MQAEAEKPKQSRHYENCLAMKTLTFEQMENIQAGSLQRALTCASQVTGGMGILFTVASIGIFALGPVGIIAFGLSVASMVTGAIADPTACDS